MALSNSNNHKGSGLPLWRHHQQVVLPVVFIYADGCFVDSSVRSTPESERSPLEMASFDLESSFISDIACLAHERLLNDCSAVDVVQFALNELSRNNGRWPCKRGSEFHQSAFMMDGDTKRAGAVGCYQSNIVHAVDASKHVLDKTEFNLLTGEGARGYIEDVLGEEGRQTLAEISGAEETFVFDSTFPLSLSVIAADKNGSIACGSFDEQRSKDKSASLRDSVLMGSGLYADSKIGSAIAVNLQRGHKTSGSCLAWQTTRLMRDFASANNGSLSSYLSSQLRRYVDENTVVFALHNSGNLPTMKLSIFSFVQPQPGPDLRPANQRKCAALSLISGGPKSNGNHFYWSKSFADLRYLSSSSLFDAHPYGSSNNLHSVCVDESQKPPQSDGPVVILVHGGAGAGAVSSEYKTAYMHGVRKAALIGYKCLAMAGNTAVEAVREAVRVMENDPVFNAGCGSYLTRSGHVEMDAMIQDGITGRFGAVGSVKRVRNAIELCSCIMDECGIDEYNGGQLMVGDCALDYAERHEIDICDETELISEKAKKAFEKWKRENSSADLSIRCGTVGAVAVDRFGNVAAATSTGGLTGKIDGRVGDTPLPGCGTAADNRLGAVSCTGVGEHIMGTCVARACLHFIEKGHSAQEAAELAVGHLANSWLGSPGGGKGGVICISPHSNDKNKEDEDKKVRQWGFAFNTEGMCWAAVDEMTGKGPVLYSGLVPGEEHHQSVASAND